MSSQYYRVKRQKHTFFINSASPASETISSLKQKLLKALQASASHLDAAVANIHSTADLKLSIPNKKDPHLFDDLIDSKTAAASGLVDQQVIALTLKTQAGAWEPVEIAQPDTASELDDLEDEPEEAPRSKGKGRAH